METSKIVMIKEINKQAGIAMSFAKSYKNCRDSVDKTHLLNKAYEVLTECYRYTGLVFKFFNSVEGYRVPSKCFAGWDVLNHGVDMFVAVYKILGNDSRLWEYADNSVAYAINYVVDLTHEYVALVEGEIE